MSALETGKLTFFYVDDQVAGTCSVDEHGGVHFPVGFVPKDGQRLRFAQPDDWDWDEFYAQYDEDAWECDLCGGEGFREYVDAPDEWGEDCPSEPNHLIPCRGCDENERAKLRALAEFMKTKNGMRESLSHERM
ncbi:MAG: hypothetical protein MI923_16005 [Phycisphaerales bacterium]|nr:hypothetical protein [Phycisphaerales bacterium]